jgi:exopolysaccharide biosynthesis polyprenyl glycosylphosphotransferase
MSRLSILNIPERKVILLIGDILLIIVAVNLFVTDALDVGFNSGFEASLVKTAGVFLFFFFSYILDFYNLDKTTRLRYVLSQSFFVTGVFVIVFFLAVVLVFDTSFWRKPLIVFLFGTPTLIFLWRLLYKNTFKFIPTTKKVLYVYDSQNLDVRQENIELINGNGEIETYHEVKLTYDIDKNKIEGKKLFQDSLLKIDTCILNVRDYNELPIEVEKMIINLIQSGKEVQSYTSFYENTYEALPIQSHNDSFYEVLQLKNKKVRYLQQIFTTLVDYGLCIVVGLVLFICLPLVYFFNLFFNKGPIFYTQKRVGKFGKEYKIYKFRSMVVDAEKAGAKMATSGDSRITPFGKILRKTRIDELPQILSVIKGDMSFIGPRPERKVFTDQLNKLTPFYNVRHIVKPGITGWAQVKYKYGENLEDSLKKLEYDLYYIKNKSISLDIRIIFKTITTVLFSKGV